MNLAELPEHPRNVIEMFDQRHWWRTRDGGWIAIAEMGREHRYNAARMLERHAAAYQLRYDLAWLHLSIGEPDGCDFMEDPQTWMLRSQLHRALVADLPRSPKKTRRLAARAAHWAECPMRLRRKDRSADAMCYCAELAIASQIAQATYGTPEALPESENPQ